MLDRIDNAVFNVTAEQRDLFETRLELRARRQEIRAIIKDEVDLCPKQQR